jgi:hypothetical protein
VRSNLIGDDDQRVVVHQAESAGTEGYSSLSYSHVLSVGRNKMASGTAIESRQAVGQEIVEAIGHAISNQLGPRVQDLILRRAGQQIELHGRVATYHAKQLVQTAALAVASEAQIVNLLNVRRHSARFTDLRPATIHLDE